MKILSGLFKIYRLVISPMFRVVFGVECRYEESCSHFMEREIREKGFWAGFWLGLKRFASCNPWMAPHKSLKGNQNG